MKKPQIFLWTGNGWGKTTSAFGAALRSLGHRKKVIIVQFMKGRKNTGEYKVQRKLGRNYRIYQFGRSGWINLKEPAEEDIKLAEKGLKFAEDTLKQKPDLLILDEINLAAEVGLLNVADILKFLNKVPKRTVVYLTGR